MTRKAVRFIAFSSAGPIIPRVSSFSGADTSTKSDSPSSSCRRSGAITLSTHGTGSTERLVPITRISMATALRATAWGGRLLVVGFAAGDIPKIPINLALLKERSIVGVYWGESVNHDPEGHLRNVKQLVEWLAAGKVKPVISERVPLSEAAAAMKRMINRQVKGKIVILPEA